MPEHTHLLVKKYPQRRGSTCSAGFYRMLSSLKVWPKARTKPTPKLPPRINKSTYWESLMASVNTFIFTTLYRQTADLRSTHSIRQPLRQSKRLPDQTCSRIECHPLTGRTLYNLLQTTGLSSNNTEFTIS